MSGILVFLQTDGSRILKASLAALEAARQMKQAWSKPKVAGVLLGPGARALAAEASKYGLDALFFCEAAELERYLAVPYSQALWSAYQEAGCDALVVPATSLGKDLLPRLSARADAGQASDIIAINSDGSLRRPMYAGDVLADVTIETAHKMISVRATAFAPAQPTSAGGAPVELKVDFDLGIAGEVVGYEGSKSDRPELADAEIVVSGGRALQSAENFQKYIFPLADALGAAVGASRAAVDSGYAPNDWQVGQTGKVVAPSLYVAVGISGAIQHLAGMKDSKVIVALNKDGDAPIFEVADYGLVADLFDAVPKLAEAIKAARAGG